VPGYSTQAGQILNYILSELCETYDFELARKGYNFNFNGTIGPYNMPSDYLRSVAQDVFYIVQVGIPYFMVWASKPEFDRFIQLPVLSAYPTRYWTDMSQSPPQMLVWPPPSGAFPVTISYYSQMPDITSPQSSAVIPWFPCQSYLIQRLAGELMKIADDARAGQFLGDSDGSDGAIEGCQSILRKYLLLKDDADNVVKQVTLDRRYFGAGSNLGESKSMDWGSIVGSGTGIH
jgi:hypothetical protein